MKVLWLVLGFLAAGVMGGVSAHLFFPPPSSRPPSELARVTARLDEVSARVDRLVEQWRMAREASGPAPGEPLPAAASEERLPGGALDPVIRPATISDTLTDDLLEEKVRETVTKMARDAQEERARRAEAAQARKEAAWLEKLRNRLDLNDYQVEELAKLLVRRRRFIADYKAKLAAGGDAMPEAQRVALEQAAKDYGRQLDAELRKLLSTTQYEGLMRIKEKGGR